MKLPFINYVKEAFALPFNLLFLGTLTVTTVGYALFAGDIDLVVKMLAFGGASAELLYLAVASEHPRLIRAVNSKHRASVDQLERQINSFKHLKSLDSEYLKRYMSFYQKKQRIIENLINKGEKTGLLSLEQIDKLNHLEAYYVDLLYSHDQFTELLRSGQLQDLLSERKRIHDEVQNASGRVQELYAKRLSLLDKRIERISAAKENLEVVRIQIDTLEDTVQYALEQSVSITHPNEIMRAIDAVIEESEIYKSTIDELDSILNEVNPSRSASSAFEELPPMPDGGLRN
jgi:hypothetical protein